MRLLRWKVRHLVALVAACAAFLAVFQYRRTTYDPTFALLRQVRYADKVGKVTAIRNVLENRDTSPVVVEALLGALGDADAEVRAVTSSVVADVAYERRRVASLKKQDDPWAGATEEALKAILSGSFHN
jgi:hypothetical protein